MYRCITSAEDHKDVEEFSLKSLTRALERKSVFLFVCRLLHCPLRKIRVALPG